MNPALLRWKFWTERQDFSAPRSYVLERNGELVAHAGLWPVFANSNSSECRAAHVIDWASDPSAPGLGASLLRRISGLLDFIFSIGGSEQAQKVLPAIGFKRATSVWTAARPLKPLRQVFSHQYVDWRLPVRLARNAWWSRSPAAGKFEGWTAAPMNADDELSMADPSPPDGSPGDAFWRYVQACPVARILIYRIFNQGEQQGTFGLSVIGKQARVLGAWLNEPSPAGLAATYTLAQRAARTLGDAYEITACGSTGTSEAAAIKSGLRVLSRTPVYLISQNALSRDIPLELQFVDSDAFFLAGASPEFLT